MTEGKKQASWEFMGSSLGLLIDIGGCFGKHLVALLVIWFLQMHFSKDTTCEQHGFSQNQKFFCHYTKAYVVCFAEVGITSIILLAMRDIFHKRFYYKLLNAGGVIHYGSASALRDPVMLLLVWDLIHIVLYVCVLSWIAYRPPEPGTPSTLASIGSSRAAGQALSHNFLGVSDIPIYKPDAQGHVPGVYDRSAFDELQKVVTHVLLPAGFFVAMFFGDYNLQKKLVPLSEFFDGLDEDNAVAQRQLGSLKVMTISDAKVTVLACKKGLFECTSIRQEDAYALMMKSWAAEKGTKKDRPHQIDLLTQLWPGFVVMNPKMIDDDKLISFKILCYVLYYSSMLLLLTVAVTKWFFFVDEVLYGSFFYFTQGLVFFVHNLVPVVGLVQLARCRRVPE